MMPRIRKGLLVIFFAVTIVLTVLLSYNLYIHFGVAKALAALDVLVHRVNITRTNVSTSVSTLFVIRNPSEFTFRILTVRERLLIGGEFVPNSYGDPAYGIVTPGCEVESFSNETLSLRVEDVLLLKSEPAENWLVDFAISLETPQPLSEVVRLQFQRKPSQVFP